MALPFENTHYDEDLIGATKVTELTDTSISNLTNNEILVYNSTTEKWENQAQGSTSVNDINDIGNVNITNIQNGQRLVYNSTTSKWENSTITDNNTDNLNDLTDTNLSSVANNETIIYNTNVGKWENGNINLNYIGDVNINSLQNGEVLKYNSTTSKWENQDNTDNLNELTDVTINSNQNHHVLKYNNTAGVYKNAFVNLTELGDTNITSLANNNILIYKSSSSAWEAGNITYTETDPVFTASPANGITSILIGKWNTAHGWGDHSTEGYLTSFTETDPVFTASPANGITSILIGKWNTAHSWGDHSIQGYLTSFTETDPVFTAHTSSGISNGSGFLKNNGSGTWTYDNNTYITAAQAPLDTPVVATASGTGNLTISSSSGYNSLLTYTPPDTVNNATNATNATYATILSGGHKIVSVDAPPLGSGGSGVPYLYSTAGLGYVPVNNVHVYFADNADKCPIVTGYGINNTNQTIVNTTTNQTIGGAKTFTTAITVDDITGGVSNVFIRYNDTSQDTWGRLRFNTAYNKFFVMRNDEFNFWNGSSAAALFLNWNGGQVYYSGSNLLSDDRIKFNETNITNGLEIIRKLSPERYTKRLPNQTTGMEEAGFIAQEVLQIPDLKFAVKHPEKEVVEGDANSRYYTLSYDSIFTYAVAGLRELDTIVQKQAQLINNQTQLISSLEARIKTLEGK